MLEEDAIERLGEILASDTRLVAAYLFGSALTSRFGPESDVDVALLPLPGSALDGNDLLELSARASEAVGRPVDIGLLSFDQLIYAVEVLSGGRPLFVKDRFLNDCFFAHALSLYAQLRFERREIERNYAV